MGYQIIKQKNNKFALWSTGIDDFVMGDVEKEEITTYFFQKEKERVQKDVDEIIAKLDQGIKPYGKMTLSFDEAIERVIEEHGEGAETIFYYKNKNILD